MADKHVTGPIQVFVVGFDKFEATGRIMAAAAPGPAARRHPRHRHPVRPEGQARRSIENSMHLTDLSEAERERLGAIAGGLIGLREGGLEGGIVGAELGALAVAERDAGLSASTASGRAGRGHPRRRRGGHPGHRAPLGGGPARRHRRAPAVGP